MNQPNRRLVGAVPTKQRQSVGHIPYEFNGLCLVGALCTKQNQATKQQGVCLVGLVGRRRYVVPSIPTYQATCSTLCSDLRISSTEGGDFRAQLMTSVRSWMGAVCRQGSLARARGVIDRLAIGELNQRRKKWRTIIMA